MPAMATVRGALGRARRAIEALRGAPPPAPAPAPAPAPPSRPVPRGVTLSDGRVMTEHPVAPHMIVDGHCLLVTPRILIGDYEPAVTRFLRGVVQPGDVVVDIGANQGFHTLTLGMSVVPGGHVHAFEPHPRTRRILEENLASNGMHHTVTVVDAVAWESDGELTFRARAGEAAGSYVRDAFAIPDDRVEGEDVTVRAVDILRFLEDLPRPPQLIKLDAEGSEERILRRAADFLRAHHPTIVTEVLPSTFADTAALESWERWLRDLGYEIAYLEHFGTAPVDAGSFRTLAHGVEVVLWAPGGRGALR